MGGSEMAWVFAGVTGGVAALLCLWTAWALARLRRLEARVSRAWTVLDTQLQRRAGLVTALARQHVAALGEKQAHRLATAATEALDSRGGDRETAEDRLGQLLALLPQDLSDVPPALLSELAGTTTRVGLARRFYNDAVQGAQTMRSRPLVRFLRLRASRPLPKFFDIQEVQAVERARLAAADALIAADDRLGKTTEAWRS